MGCARRRSLVYRLTGAGQRLLGLPRIANAHCWGAGATPEGVDRIVSPMGSKRWKIVL
jgi:hypothetical protein